MSSTRRVKSSSLIRRAKPTSKDIEYVSHIQHKLRWLYHVSFGRRFIPHLWNPSPVNYFGFDVGIQCSSNTRVMWSTPHFLKCWNHLLKFVWSFVTICWGFKITFWNLRTTFRSLKTTCWRFKTTVQSFEATFSSFETKLLNFETIFKVLKTIFEVV